jgi:hypothetical protein
MAEEFWYFGLLSVLILMCLKHVYHKTRKLMDVSKEVGQGVIAKTNCAALYVLISLLDCRTKSDYKGKCKSYSPCG